MRQLTAGETARAPPAAAALANLPPRRHRPRRLARQRGGQCRQLHRRRRRRHVGERCDPLVELQYRCDLRRQHADADRADLDRPEFRHLSDLQHLLGQCDDRQRLARRQRAWQPNRRRGAGHPLQRQGGRHRPRRQHHLFLPLDRWRRDDQRHRPVHHHAGRQPGRGLQGRLQRRCRWQLAPLCAAAEHHRAEGVERLRLPRRHDV